MLLELIFLIMMRKQGNRWGKKKNSFVCWWNFHGSRIPIPAVGKERLQSVGGYRTIDLSVKQI
jgi:hypothetical protein